MTERKFYAVVEFEDGLQVIPDNWINKDLIKAVWPNFTNNKRYYKAVKLMEEPLSTWLEHPIRKLYGKFCKCLVKYIIYDNIYMYVQIFLNNIEK